MAESRQSKSRLCWTTCPLSQSQIEEQRLSAARAGAIVTLGRAKSWHSELDQGEIATKCSEFKDDHSPFEERDFNRRVREMRPVACILVEELNFHNYTMAYDSNNQKIKMPAHAVVNLIHLGVCISLLLTLIIQLYSMMKPLLKL